jgi:hypothetical protein
MLQRKIVLLQCKNFNVMAQKSLRRRLGAPP